MVVFTGDRNLTKINAVVYAVLSPLRNTHQVPLLPKGKLTSSTKPEVHRPNFITKPPQDHRAKAIVKMQEN